MIEAQFVSHKVQQNLTSADQKIARENIGINADFLSQYGGNNIGCHSAISADIPLDNPLGLYSAYKSENASYTAIPAGTSYDTIFSMLFGKSKARSSSISMSLSPTGTSVTRNLDASNYNDPITAELTSVTVNITEAMDIAGNRIPFVGYAYKRPGDNTITTAEYPSGTDTTISIPLNDSKNMSVINDTTYNYYTSAWDANNNKITTSKGYKLSKTTKWPYYYGVYSSLSTVLTSDIISEISNETNIKNNRKGYDIGNSPRITFELTESGYPWLCVPNSKNYTKMVQGGFTITTSFNLPITITLYGQSYKLYICNARQSNNMTVDFS